MNDDEDYERMRREGLENTSFVIWLVICGVAVLLLGAGIAGCEAIKAL